MGGPERKDDLKVDRRTKCVIRFNHATGFIPFGLVESTGVVFDYNRSYCRNEHEDTSMDLVFERRVIYILKRG